MCVELLFVVDAPVRIKLSSLALPLSLWIIVQAIMIHKCCMPPIPMLAHLIWLPVLVCVLLQLGVARNTTFIQALLSRLTLTSRLSQLW